MTSRLHQFALPPALLTRGFWLYVWKITSASGGDFYYVGMTGDTGSGVAQSPMNRISAHLGSNFRNNTLRKHAADKVTLETCKKIEFAAYGPLLSVPKAKPKYQKVRQQVAELEKGLWLEMCGRKLSMLNPCPRCRNDGNRREAARIYRFFKDAFHIS